MMKAEEEKSKTAAEQAAKAELNRRISVAGLNIEVSSLDESALEEASSEQKASSRPIHAQQDKPTNKKPEPKA